jgi:ribonuclease BN (tRNA processing enzyme)
MPDPNVVELAAGADLLIHDAHFSLEERARLAHWGHSSWLEAAEAAREAGVRLLALFHHNPDAGDRYLQEEVLRRTREVFPNTILAQEGLAIDLPLAEAPGDMW